MNEKQALLGIYSMPADEGWSVVAGRRSYDLFGKVPENKLKSTATGRRYSGRKTSNGILPVCEI